MVKRILKGMCEAHYTRWKKYGDPLVTRDERSSRGSPDSVSVGDMFGRWTVVGPYVRRPPSNNAHFPCRCACGTEREVVFRTLREVQKGKTTLQGSCGCAQKEVMATHRKYGFEPGTPEYHRARWLHQEYGMSLAEYDEMLTEQGGKCKICRRVYDKLWVDHDHDTGEVRGLLCPGCNTAIGHFREDVGSMKNAIQYLEESVV